MSDIVIVVLRTEPGTSEPQTTIFHITIMLSDLLPTHFTTDWLALIFSCMEIYHQGQSILFSPKLFIIINQHQSVLHSYECIYCIYLKISVRALGVGTLSGFAHSCMLCTLRCLLDQHSFSNLCLSDWLWKCSKTSVPVMQNPVHCPGLFFSPNYEAFFRENWSSRSDFYVKSLLSSAHRSYLPTQLLSTNSVQDLYV